MSITAFPVLARIIRDRKLTDQAGHHWHLHAASDDVTAWCILAILIAFIRSGSNEWSGRLSVWLPLWSYDVFFVKRLEWIQLKYR
jgi:Kef-type K+ transport system membrane component KefB